MLDVDLQVILFPEIFVAVLLGAAEQVVNNSDFQGANVNVTIL